MRKFYSIFAILIIAAFVLSACAQVSPTETAVAVEPQPTKPPAKPTQPEVIAPTAEMVEPETPVVTEEVIPEPEVVSIWDQDYIDQVPPIMMIEPYFKIFGQSQVAVPYYYDDVVKYAGHSCGATTGAWTITKKALEALYPNGEIPVRGQISVAAPGAENEWYTGVFGDIIAYITGASAKTGFIGAEFGEANDLFVRQNKMVYPEEPTGTLPPKMEWIFSRLDTGRKVGVNFNLAIITPIATEERQQMGAKLAKGAATAEEAKDYQEYWNDRAKFVLENADMDGFFTVTTYDEGLAVTPASIVSDVKSISPDEFAWDQAYITEVPPIMVMEPYFQIFGQSQEPVPYYYEEAVKLAGHSCGATTGAWTITKKALEILYPNGEIPVRGQIAVEAPGAEDEWFVGVFGDIISFVTGASPATGFIGSEFGKANDLFIRQDKMVYSEKPTKQLPPMREWIFTRLDTGKKVGIKFNLVVITPLPTPGRVAMGKKLATGQASAEEALDYYKYWNDRAEYVLKNADMSGFFTVKIYE
ncbi:MAG: hypothetical protein BGO78_12645 [Chloroflexi bacterium 44-23]|nr:MAG: hypothetical protein BGO78_12645 [Chloroflexi bacterium 44-23]